MSVDVTKGNTESWLEVIWDALHAHQDSQHIIEEDWDDICTAMAWIRESLGLPSQTEAFEPKPEMLVNEWAELLEDGMIYRLVRCTPEEVLPWRFSLECCSDYHTVFGGKFAADEEIVEVCDSAFSDFDELCGFAKEVAAILHCEPATIVRAI